METDETLLFARPEFEGELAQLLRNAARENAVTETAGHHPPLDASLHTSLHTPLHTPLVPPPTPPPAGTHPHGQSPLQDPSPLPRHRRQRRLPWRGRGPGSGEGAAAWWLRCASMLLAAAASAIVAMLSVLGGVTSYQPLRDIASPAVSEALGSWWPLLIYGPWLVACLSILRAALHQRSALHSWLVMVVFSALAVGLCVAGSPPTVTGVAVAGLAPVSALVAFHQLVRQITLIHPPRHALPRQRR
ncbi:DUF2637 domain-containing protein [Streptomyces sp. 6N223]|uniref:DUF2637 domain-containing protein n=1 Tax=Streptomyces sp. 6N223 TaxID=3457412 RepID=UPI003FD11ACA